MYSTTSRKYMGLLTAVCRRSDANSCIVLLALSNDNYLGLFVI